MLVKVPVGEKYMNKEIKELIEDYIDTMTEEQVKHFKECAAKLIGNDNLIEMFSTCDYNSFIELNVLIPLIFAVVFLMIDIAMLIRMIYLLKKSKDDTVENLGKKLNPYLNATGVVSILMTIFMIIVIVTK